MAFVRNDRQIPSFPLVRKVGIISDTHGLLEQVVLDYFKQTELIFHAGDICDGRNSKGRESEDVILSKLRSLAPVLAVRGNVDSASLLPDVQTFRMNRGMVRGLVVHGHEPRIKWSQKDIAENKVPKMSSDLIGVMHQQNINMLIFGHSHIPGVIFSQGVIYINPGSAGPKRFSLPQTLAQICFTDGKIIIDIYDFTRQCLLASLEVKENLLK